jgi:menaquinol-cytochrome c reductase cytochrome b/c subunit
MAKMDKNATFVGDSRVSAKRVPNIAPSYSDFPGKSEPFWPNFLLKEWMVAAVCLVAFLVLTVSEAPPLTEKANPNDTSFIPLPDWYFLFLYQFLKYPWAAGDYVLLGILGIPGIAFGALLLAPWLDTGKERRFYRRPVASGLMLLTLVSIFYLTWEAMDQHHKNHGSNARAGEKGDPNFAVEEIWTAQASCMGCHGQHMEGGMGPSLQKVGGKYTAEQIADIIKKGKGQMPAGLIKDEKTITELSQYLSTLK